ncbi:hypothetical protein [Streptomyces sp. NPDC102437]|uniref:hypothetical protein n=1 Tax=Streptomyces sp. NPDC102437 TaxID=3366175 RepID=UPI003806A7F2
MINAAQIARALAPDVSTRSVADRLGCPWGRVQQVREACGVPTYRRGRRPAAPWRERYAAHTEPVAGGHMRWTGPAAESGTPVLSVQGRPVTVYRLLFQDEHGREPEGHVRPGCGYARCVAGGHLEDRRVREERVGR